MNIERKQQFDPVDKENIILDKNEKKSSSKTFLLIASGIVILALVIWAVMNSGKNKTGEATVANIDSISQEVAPKDTQNIQVPTAATDSNTLPGNKNPRNTNPAGEEKATPIMEPGTDRPSVPKPAISRQNMKSVTEQVITVDRNNSAANVREVNYCNSDNTNCGSFKLMGEKAWLEKNFDGAFKYEETSRDEHSIYLKGNYNITLDLRTKQVLANNNMLYKITGFK